MSNRLVFAATVAAALFAASSAFATITPTVTLLPSPTLTMHAPQYGSRETTLTVKVNGSSPVTFGATTFGGANDSDFAISLDGCAGHTIKAGSFCRIHVVFTPSAAKGTTETATITVNDSGNNLLASDDISGIVTEPQGVYATVLGDVITIHNPTGNDPGMDYTTGGTLVVTGGNCVDIIFAHKNCTLDVSVSGGPGSIDIEIFESPDKHFVFEF